MLDFSKTHWSQIGRLGDSPELDDCGRDAWEGAWRHLTSKYEPAFRCIARDTIRRCGGSVVQPDHAADVVQGFLTACLEKRWLQKAAPQFGRFRAFAFTLLRRYTLKYVDAAKAQKRHPKSGQVSLSDLAPSLEPSVRDDCGADGASSWAHCMLDVCTERVSARSPANADVLRLILNQGIDSNQTIAELLGCKSDRVALARHRGMKMLREELHDELCATVRSSSAYAEELMALRPYFATEVTGGMG